MRVSTNPPQHLSNCEVLTHFLGLKQDNDRLQRDIVSYDERAKAIAKKTFPMRDDKKGPKPRMAELSPEEKQALDVASRRGISEDLTWVQNQVINYLCSDYNPTSRQNPEGVQDLARNLQRHGLVKAEVLQICNLAPTLPVELYCIIEETDQRFQPNPSAKLEEIVGDVIATLSDEPTPEVTALLGQVGATGVDAAGQFHEGIAMEGMEEAMIGQEYVHEAEWGAGHEDGVGEEKEDIMEQ